MARVHEDLGRAYLDLQDDAAAETHLNICSQLATEHAFADLQFFAHKDRALLFSQRKNWFAAEEALRAASEILPRLSGDYFGWVLAAAQGELLAARGSPAAIATLGRAAEGFSALSLGEQELSARVTLAKALLADGERAAAEQAILRGLGLARRKGWRRWDAKLNELLASLDLIEGATIETARKISTETDRAETDYVLIQRLGGGAFGEVFRAYDPRRGQEVALKRLLLPGFFDARIRAQLIRSARIELDVASRVRHPGIARVLALGTDTRDNAYVVQEFVAGPTLRQAIGQSAGFSISEKLLCLSRVAYALDALHSAGVCHRDLKPDNIILRAEDNTPLLIDFGVAHSMAADTHGEFAGTLDYSSPEQLLGKAVDGRADLYSLGVTAFEWICGLRPWSCRGMSPADAAYALAHHPRVSLREYCPSLDEAADQLLASLLAFKPRHRPANAHQVAQQLERLAAHGG